MSELKLVEGKQYVYRSGIRCKLIHWDEENKTWISIRLDDNSLADELRYHYASGVAIGFSGFDIVSEYIEPPKPMTLSGGGGMNQEKLNPLELLKIKSFQLSLVDYLEWRWFIGETFTLNDLNNRIVKMVINGTSDGEPCGEPVRVPTEKDAKSRPWVMVRDPQFMESDWNLRQLVTTLGDDEMGKFICLSSCGKVVSYWSECRFPTEDEREEHGI